MIKLRHLNNNTSQGQPVTGNLKCLQKGRKLQKQQTMDDSRCKLTQGDEMADRRRDNEHA